MQDWNYLAGSCMDITLELNRQKNPDSRLLYQMWQDNKEALIALPIAAALGGIHGNVTDAATGGQHTSVATPFGLKLACTLSLERCTVCVFTACDGGGALRCSSYGHIITVGSDCDALFVSS